MKSRIFAIVFAIIAVGYLGFTNDAFREISKILEVQKDKVTLSKCIDGDTAKFDIGGEEKTVRFLLVDTPESTKTVEPYGKEASKFTCYLLTNASNIMLEYDFEELDKYGRTLAWIWADDKLVQEEIAKNGFVKKFYDYGKYKYETQVKESVNDKYNIFEGE